MGVDVNGRTCYFVDVSYRHRRIKATWCQNIKKAKIQKVENEKSSACDGLSQAQLVAGAPTLTVAIIKIFPFSKTLTKVKKCCTI